MKRKILVWMVFAAIAVVAIAVPAGALDSYVYRFSGDRATAFFRSEEGDQLVNVSLTAWDGKSQVAGSRGTSGSGTDVWLWIYDKNTNEMLMDVQGYISLAPADFVMGNQLNAASLFATVNAFDYVSQQPQELTLDVDWQATGSLYKGTYSYRYQSDSGFYMSRGTGSHRAASASAMISSGGSLLYQGISDFAELNSDTNANVTVDKFVYFK